MGFSYYNVLRDAKYIKDDMGRRDPEVWVTVTFWDLQAPEDAPGSLLQDVYKQQGEKLQLNWSGLPKPFDWKLHHPKGKLDITVAIKAMPLGSLSRNCWMPSMGPHCICVKLHIFISSQLDWRIRPL